MVGAFEMQTYAQPTCIDDAHERQFRGSCFPFPDSYLKDFENRVCVDCRVVHELFCYEASCIGGGGDSSSHLIRFRM